VQIGNIYILLTVCVKSTFVEKQFDKFLSSSPFCFRCQRSKVNKSEANKFYVESDSEFSITISAGFHI